MTWHAQPCGRGPLTLQGVNGLMVKAAMCWVLPHLQRTRSVPGSLPAQSICLCRALWHVLPAGSFLRAQLCSQRPERDCCTSAESGHYSLSMPQTHHLGVQVAHCRALLADMPQLALAWGNSHCNGAATHVAELEALPGGTGLQVPADMVVCGSLHKSRQHTLSIFLVQTKPVVLEPSKGCCG